ncbi:hypothetical protein LTR85_011214 [Meristemomyces frigidus]|nr:hypothetical protein LTR85_011214 [Meristemomyces frigidus]
MNRLWELNGSDRPESPPKRHSTRSTTGRTAKKPEQAASASKSTSRASTLPGSEPAEAVKGDSSRSTDTIAAETATHSAEDAAEKFVGLFNPGHLSLDEYHEKRVENASRVSEHLRKPFTPDSYDDRHPNERVFRVWIPEDPDDSTLLGEHTHVRTVHNKPRAHILRLIEDQLEATEKVYEIRQRYLGSLTARIAGAGADANPFASAKKDLTILSLRMKGVEVVEYQERPERIEVHWQDLYVKAKGRFYGIPVVGAGPLR